MAWTSDYSGDWAYIDGVQDGTYTAPGGSADPCKVLQSELTRRELSGGILGISPTDVPFVCWAISGDAVPQATLTVDGTTYTVISTSKRADGTQQRLICRAQV